MSRIISDPQIERLLIEEEKRQKEGLELIASENFVSQEVRLATGSILTNKYAEGYPHKRYYGGCQWVDEIEQLAIERAKTLFRASWANVQPHSGSQANAAVLLALLEPNDKLLGFNLAHGGHLTHGSKVNFSGQLYQAYHYGVAPNTGEVDYDQIIYLAHKHKPKVIICGGSAYSQDWNYSILRKVSDEVGAILIADIAHPAGFIAHGLLKDPFPYVDILTTTTHKTLRGPRGGMILMQRECRDPRGRVSGKGVVRKLSSILNSAVFPGTQGGPLMHVIAAKAIALREALSDQYKKYIKEVQYNASVLGKVLKEKGYQIIGGETKNHLLLIDLSATPWSGAEAEKKLDRAGITLNKNAIPFDQRSFQVTSGIRIGTAAITTRGLQAIDMRQIATWIDRGLQGNEEEGQQIKEEIKQFMQDRPLFKK